MNKLMKFLTVAAICGTGAFLGGCNLAPKHQKVELPVSKEFAKDSIGKGDAIAAELGWRDFFGDARLKAIVALALENNRDLRVAALRVEQAAAQYQIQRSYLLPSLGGSGAWTRQRTPGDLARTPTGEAATTSQYSVGANLMSYEVDLFGRVRNLKDAALESYLATEESQRAVQIGLVAGVATQYMAGLMAEEQLKLVSETLGLVEKSYKLIKDQFDAGVASELDLRMSETQVYSAKADVEIYTRAKEQAANALVLLVGCPLPEELPAGANLMAQGLVSDLPAGVPSDLLQRRPDILGAEHSLWAADANIGAARAAFFPAISLTAFGGTASASLDGLFKGGSAMWSFAPQITVPIFTGGRLKANLASTKAAQKIAVAQYEKTIQTAFREVADGLAARRTYVKQTEAQELLVGASKRRFELSEQRFERGADDYLSVLTAQQSLYGAQRALLAARYEQLSNLVTLYKALGGGWVEGNK